MTISLEMQCRALKLPAPVAEFCFHPERKWRFDWAWVPQKLALEQEGGAFLAGGGRHTRGAGFRRDTEKYAEAAILGWRVIRVLPEQVADGTAVGWIERAFNAEKP